MSELMEEYNATCDCSDNTIDDDEEDEEEDKEEEDDEERLWGEETSYTAT